MTDTYNNFVSWAWQRKHELTEIILKRCNHTVWAGPFRGMKILPQAQWGDGDLVGKVLGLYECELFASIQHAWDLQPQAIVNIGCADGYYGIGLARQLPVPLLLVDTDTKSLDIARQNAQANRVSQVTYTDNSSTDFLSRWLQPYQNAVIFMDCEGCEKNILDMQKLPQLENCIIIVESHDVWLPGITSELMSRFQKTHQIDVISQGAKNPYLDITFDFSDFDKVLLCCEGRPQTATWLFMKPWTLVK